MASPAASHSVDGACCQRILMHEIFSLHRSNRRCPVSPRLRRGWETNLRRCNCSAGSGTVPPGPTCPRDGASQFAERNLSVPMAANGSSFNKAELLAAHHQFCEHWAVGKQRKGTLAQSCSRIATMRTCGGTCCKMLPWPHLGAWLPWPGYPKLESVC